MAKLYELTDEYRADVARLQELDLPPEVVLDTIEGMQGELTDKIKAVVIVSMEMDAEAATRKEHATRMANSAKAIAGRAEGLRSYAQIALQNSGLKLPLKFPEFSITLKKNPLSCTVSDAAKLAPSLRKTTITMDLPETVSAQAFMDFLSTYLPESDALKSEAQAIASSVLATETPDKAAVLRALKTLDEENAKQLKMNPEAPPEKMEGAYINPTGYRLSVD